MSGPPKRLMQPTNRGDFLGWPAKRAIFVEPPSELVARVGLSTTNRTEAD